MRVTTVRLGQAPPGRGVVRSERWCAARGAGARPAPSRPAREWPHWSGPYPVPPTSGPGGRWPLPWDQVGDVGGCWGAVSAPGPTPDRLSARARATSSASVSSPPAPGPEPRVCPQPALGPWPAGGGTPTRRAEGLLCASGCAASLSHVCSRSWPMHPWAACARAAGGGRRLASMRAHASRVGVRSVRRPPSVRRRPGGLAGRRVDASRSAHAWHRGTAGLALRGTPGHRQWRAVVGVTRDHPPVLDPRVPRAPLDPKHVRDARARLAPLRPPEA